MLICDGEDRKVKVDSFVNGLSGGGSGFFGVGGGYYKNNSGLAVHVGIGVGIGIGAAKNSYRGNAFGE